MSTESAAPLSYASPGEAKPVVALYRVALFCWLTPLVVGLTTLGLYALTFRSWLTLVGMVALLVGGALLLVGLVCLAAFYLGLRRCDDDTRRAWAPRAHRTAMLLVSNVLVAFACAIAGLFLASQFPVTLVNETNLPVTDIVLTSPGETAELDRLDPGDSRRVLLTVNNDGEVTFTARQNGMPVTGVANGYVTHGPSNGTATVRFTNAGPVVATSR